MCGCTALLRAQGHPKWWSHDQAGDKSAVGSPMYLKKRWETAADWLLGVLLKEVLKYPFEVGEKASSIGSDE